MTLVFPITNAKSAEYSIGWGRRFYRLGKLSILSVGKGYCTHCVFRCVSKHMKFSFGLRFVKVSSLMPVSDTNGSVSSRLKNSASSSENS